jgi:spore coat protein Y
MEAHPLLHKLQHVHFVQAAIHEPQGVQKLLTTEPYKDTIPMLIYLKNGNLFTTYGNIGGSREGGKGFTSPFFRIEQIEEHYAMFSLLKPTYESMSIDKEITDVTRLERTNHTVDLDINIIGGVQFLSPSLVK